MVTAAEIATRCFPDTVSVVLPAKVDSASMLFWPNLEDRPSFGGLLRQIVGTHNVVPERGDLPRSNVLLFGDAPEIEGALRVTFDGWVAKTGPVSRVARLPERPYCSLVGILAAALSISELFLSFADISLDARRRTVALSLWRGCRPRSGCWVSVTSAMLIFGHWGRCPTSGQTQLKSS